MYGQLTGASIAFLSFPDNAKIIRHRKVKITIMVNTITPIRNIMPIMLIIKNDFELWDKYKD